MIIAIDGPSGSGKSTLGRMLARALNLLYIDTGSMYRAVALAVIDAQHRSERRRSSHDAGQPRSTSISKAIRIR